MRLRRAAAAAAEDRFGLEVCDFRKAWLAADWADCAAGEESGWIWNGAVSFMHSAGTRWIALLDLRPVSQKMIGIRLDAFHTPDDEQKHFFCDGRSALFKASPRELARLCQKSDRRTLLDAAPGFRVRSG